MSSEASTMSFRRCGPRLRMHCTDQPRSSETLYSIGNILSVVGAE